ncbi:hypothetical protein BGZ95_010834 [Linnemannia exigua]|uniref:F-box domain-containing protein n=1 Tax=Linnemannia exigua TaxID=604196 RepID=A0AAD4HAA8_9FUNG|nr:hypothetical protein BGZ95_010834 [Linnemannia exigua]
MPELLKAISAYLNGISFIACIQVCKHWNESFIPILWNTIDDSLYAWPRILRRIDEDQRVFNEAWLRDIFAKYGQYIRHLVLRWRVLIDIAYLNKACTNLFSIKILDIKQFHTLNEEYAVRLMKYRTPRGSRRYPNQRHSLAVTGPVIVPELKGVFAPTAILLKTEERQLKDWMTHQYFWMLLRQNPGLQCISLHSQLDLLSELKSMKFVYDTFAMLPNLTTLESHHYPLEYDILLSRVPSLRNYSSAIVPPMPAFDLIGPFGNLRSLTINTSTPWIKLNRILRSTPSLTKLNLLYVNDLANNSASPSSSTESGAPFSETFHITSLAINNSSRNASLDPEMANFIFQHLPELNEICFAHLSLDISTAAAQFYPQLEQARQLCDGDSLYTRYYPKHTGGSFLTPLVNSQGPLFRSCRYLRVFDAIQHSFDADHISNTLWVCDGLEVFRCQIVGLSRLNQDEHSILSYITESGLQEDDCSTEELRILKKAHTCRCLHVAVYNQLARFVKLRVLDLGYEYRNIKYPTTSYTVAGNEYRYYGDVIQDTMQLSLASGLDQLSTLENLEVFGFEGVDHEIDLLEIEWIAEHWPRLKVMRGLQKDDHLRYVKPDKFRRMLRRKMQSLRPSIRHESGKMW